MSSRFSSIAFFTAAINWFWLREGADGAAAEAAGADSGATDGGFAARDGADSASCRPGGAGGGGRDGGGELLDQHAELVDLADHALHAVGAGRIGRHHLALDGRKPAAELRHL